jgi:hypothetical protein
MRRIPDGPGSLLKLPCASAPVTELGASPLQRRRAWVHDLAKPARVISRAATLGKTQDFDQLNAMTKCNCNDVPYANGTTGRMHALAIDADMSRCREGGCS